MLKSLPLTPVFSSFAFPKTFLRTLQPCLRLLQASRILPGWIRAGSCGIRSCSGSALRPSIEADLDRAYRLDNGAVLTTRFGGIAVFAALANNGTAGTVSAGLNLSNDLHWDFASSLLYGIESDARRQVLMRASDFDA
ncbi:hypothetical protein JVX98_00490 (plasmid) [Ensifer sp. PDNC004]|uniref:hypothetical protein n=1 Tax=Ensifer sp. PDNC004 TaxID=2811423 RepID=UPI00196524D8|nr:hypothetical protein [Ensifer sp. PDNC004]QRY65618.1 hypothetical protein JVX98_00490 [Ensifer sp. PDNC004]